MKIVDRLVLSVRVLYSDGLNIICSAGAGAIIGSAPFGDGVLGLLGGLLSLAFILGAFLFATLQWGVHDDELDMFRKSATVRKNVKAKALSNVTKEDRRDLLASIKKYRTYHIDLLNEEKYKLRDLQRRVRARERHLATVDTALKKAQK